jgi:hypothetical protein
MVRTIVRYHHWTPEYCAGLYHDDIDPFGLEYWYIDVKECLDDLKKKK